MAELRVKSTGTLKLFENDNTSSVTIASPASLGGDRTITLPDASVTLASGTMLATDGSGASLTALNASELGSGTVPTARLGSGTASSSTVLYGDQTYKAEPGGTNTPSFQAYGDAGQSCANATTVLTAFNQEYWDTDSDYDTSLYRFTPSVAGKYYVYMTGQWATNTDFDGSHTCIIHKNGSGIASNNGVNRNSDTVYLGIAVDMNGSSDYVDAHMKQASGGAITNALDDATRMRFGAFRLI